jgi:hypothetical protein
MQARGYALRREPLDQKRPVLRLPVAASASVLGPIAVHMHAAPPCLDVGLSDSLSDSLSHLPHRIRSDGLGETDHALD